eukprot:1839696-Ditylum_brightwellii.AAC.1
MPMPPVPPNLNAFVTVNKSNDAIHRYNKEKMIYDTYEIVVKVLQKQLLGIFDGVYFLALYNQATGHEDLAVINLLKHLYANYGDLDSTITCDNNTMVREVFDATNGIKKYIAKVENCVDIAHGGGAPITPPPNHWH